jgi:hypothetical protein
VTYYTLRVLGWLGVVHGIREPTAAMRDAVAPAAGAA